MPRKKQKQPLPAVAELPEEAKRWLEQVVTGPMTAEAVEDVMRYLGAHALLRSEAFPMFIGAFFDSMRGVLDVARLLVERVKAVLRRAGTQSAWPAHR